MKSSSLGGGHYAWRITQQQGLKGSESAKLESGQKNVSMSQILASGQRGHSEAALSELVKEAVKVSSEQNSQAKSSTETVQQLIKPHALIQNGAKGFVVRQEFYKNGTLIGVVQKPLQFKKLSGKARKVLQDVDGWTSSDADTGAPEAIEAAVNDSQALSKKLRQRSVFLSYRLTYRKEAFALMQLIQSFEQQWRVSPIFHPHNQPITEEQVKASIDGADLFLVLGQGDYGRVGSMSRLELEYAHSIRQRKPFPWMTSIVFDRPEADVLEIISQSSRTLFMFDQNLRENLEKVSLFIYALISGKEPEE